MVNCACWVPAGHLLLFRSSRHVSDLGCPQRDCFEFSWKQARRQDTYADAVEVGSLVSSQKLELAVRDSPRIIRVRQGWFGPDETTSTAQRAPTSDLASGFHLEQSRERERASVLEPLDTLRGRLPKRVVKKGNPLQRFLPAVSLILPSPLFAVPSI